MNKLLILGAGQYGTVAKEIAEAMGMFDKIDFLDDNKPVAIGKLSDYEKFSDYQNAFVAIGNPFLRSEYLKRLKPVYNVVSLIHPKACLSASAEVAGGCILEQLSSVGCCVSLGAGCFVMSNATVGHNVTVGECCILKYNCTIPENSVVPAFTKIMYNSVYVSPAFCPRNLCFEDGM